MTYSYAEVYSAALDYFKGDELAASTWVSKYAVKDLNGNFIELTPHDMHKRMAKEFARIEKSYGHALNEHLSEYGRIREPLGFEKIYEMFKEFRYLIPQGSVMAALGNPFMLASLSNCVVLPPVFDSYGGIFYTDQQMAQLFKRRCGVGIDISTLRPAGQYVSNAARTTSGAVTFMERFSNTTREVAQHGRRGALMITIDVAHPDIFEFVTSKQDLDKITGANISVRLSDEFMRCVEKDLEFKLRWPVDAADPIVTRNIKARDLWDLIIQNAHRAAEPGLIFWDRQHRYSTSSVYPGYRNVSTNPCSEIAMQGGDSCRLMAVNLLGFVDSPFTSSASFDWKKFHYVCYEGQRLMDDLVDLELEAIQRILEKIENDPEPDHIKETERRTWELLKDAGAKGRRTGLGFTALADTFAALGMKYASTDSLRFLSDLMKTKCRAEFESSVDMAIERGKFADFNMEFELQSDFIKMFSDEFADIFERMKVHGRRNISISTVAPTGSLSIMAKTSSGIEPVFMLSYKRRRKVDPTMKEASVDFIDSSGDRWQEHEVLHPGFELWKGKNAGVEVDKSPYHGSTAAEIEWKRRLELQSIVQKYVTHSISSTINLPSETDESTVSDIYLTAWKLGLKGITVYREGSRSGVLVADDEKRELASAFKETIAPKRPKKLHAEVLKFRNGNENWIAFIGLLEDRPYEIFTGRKEDSFDLPEEVRTGWIVKEKISDGSKRYDFHYRNKEGRFVILEGLSRKFDKAYWNYAKLISGVLRHGMPLPQVIDLVHNLDLMSESINTWKNGVERALKKFIPAGTPPAERECPECGDPEGLVYEEGCIKCRNCLMSRCG